ncbi:MAG: hypothetical protein IBX57_06800 [Gammaproteobacteria bacterium]|nr:hypothetical protein [Gammaproteobacteria bacterium]
MTVQFAQTHLLSSSPMRGTIGRETHRYRWIAAVTAMTRLSNLTAN